MEHHSEKQKQKYEIISYLSHVCNLFIVYCIDVGNCEVISTMFQVLNIFMLNVFSVLNVSKQLNALSVVDINIYRCIQNWKIDKLQDWINQNQNRSFAKIATL